MSPGDAHPASASADGMSLLAAGEVRRPGAPRTLVVRALCLSIRVYQLLISPLLGNCCRFEPSCSRYAQLCIERLGPMRGTWLGFLRLLRCHPFCPGGHDPPPEVTS